MATLTVFPAPKCVRFSRSTSAGTSFGGRVVLTLAIHPYTFIVIGDINTFQVGLRGSILLKANLNRPPFPAVCPAYHCAPVPFPPMRSTGEEGGLPILCGGCPHSYHEDCLPHGSGDQRAAKEQSAADKSHGPLCTDTGKVSQPGRLEGASLTS